MVWALGLLAFGGALGVTSIVALITGVESDLLYVTAFAGIAIVAVANLIAHAAVTR